MFGIIYIGDIMKIEKINKLKSGKYKLTLESNDKIITYDDVILKNNLMHNKEVDDKLLNLINQDTEFYDVYNKTIKYISIRMRSQKEIEEYLGKFNLNDHDFKNIISNLKRIGLIDDKLYAKAYSSDRINLSNDGPNKIKSDLLNLNISEDYVDEVISTIDKEIVSIKLSKLIKKRVKSNHKHSNYMLKQKITIDLVNLGYNRDDIIELIDAETLETNDILNDNYNKIYDKLSRKFEGKELIMKIKQKLYQKGFDISEVNEFMSTKCLED
jgi:regulatory protein